MANEEVRALNPLGYLTEFVVHDDGSGVGVIHTRFPWEDFDEEWQEGFIAYARQVYVAERGAGRVVTRVAFDHISLKRKTFQPRIDLEKVF